MKWTILCVLTLTACVREGSVERVHLPNGSFGAIVRCDTRAECFRKSSSVCSNYHVVMAEDHEARDFIPQPFSMKEYVVQCSPDKKVDDDDQGR